MRRFRIFLAGAALLSLAAYLVLRWQAAGLERRIEARIVAEAARIGAVARVERVRVALWPPLVVTGLVIEKPGRWQGRVEELSVRPRLRGRSGLGPFIRIAVGPTVVALPGDLEVRLNATEWDWDGRSTVELAEPTEGLSLHAVSERDVQRFTLTATELDIGRLAGLRLEQAVLQPGRVDGELSGERRADQSIDARWRVRASFGECSGKAELLRSASPARLQLGFEVDQLDFARLFSSLGLELPLGAAALGSLHADLVASGPLDDPASITVTQQLDFKPPPKLPPALLRLQGDFVHEATAPDGSQIRIDVSPGSSDFVARADVPPLFVKTLLLAEDSAFFTHRGLDLGELPKALAANWAQGGAVRGASTLTQQLAKNLFLSREKSLKSQAPGARARVSARAGARQGPHPGDLPERDRVGPRPLRPAAAAGHYFGKDPGTFSPKEMAFLVVMIPGPVKYQRSFNEGVPQRGPRAARRSSLLAKLRSVDGAVRGRVHIRARRDARFQAPQTAPPVEP